MAPAAGGSSSSSEAWAENVEQGDSGVDEGPEDALAAVLHVRDAPSEVVHALKCRLPVLLLTPTKLLYF